MGGASSFSTNTHGWRGPPGPFDSSVIPAFRRSRLTRHSCLPSFPSSVIPAFRRSRLTRHSCLPSFPSSVIPAFRRSRLTRHSCLLLFRPSVIPARLPSFPPTVIPAKAGIQGCPSNASLPVLKVSGFPPSAGMTASPGMTALAGMTGTMRANPENEKALRAPPTGIDDASRRHIMSGNPPDTPKLEM